MKAPGDGAATSQAVGRDLAHIYSDLTVEASATINLRLAELEERLNVGFNLRLGQVKELLTATVNSEAELTRQMVEKQGYMLATLSQKVNEWESEIKAQIDAQTVTVDYLLDSITCLTR